MPDADNPTAKTLAELGIQDPPAIAEVFAKIRERFERDAAAARDEASWKQFRDAWLGRKSGVLTQIGRAHV